MTDSHLPRKCPQCGAELPADASPDQPCPACLMKLGLESWAARGDEHPAEDSPTTPWRSRFEPPALQDLAAVFPNLEILELVGAGGMGAVYKARQPNLDRIVALKILPAELGSDPAFEERFTREAKALARFNHPNIVTVYDFGQALGAGLPTPPNPANEGLTGGPQDAGDSSDTSGQTNGSVGDRQRRVYFLLMEYVDGVNLRQLIRGRQMEPAQALALVPQICDAMQFAHDKGIVHRDIKPENILVDTTGRVKIADFGLAKMVGRPLAEVPLTDTQQVVGTAHYMAPEQTRGSRAIDHRADIYSLGVVFYEMLTGELPVGRFEPPSRKVHVDVRLDNVVLRALENEPDRRYQHASDVKTDVERIASDGSPAAELAASAERVSGGGFLRELATGWLSYVLVMFCLGIIVMGIGSVWQFGIHGEVNGRPLPTVGIYAWGRWMLVVLGAILAAMGIAGGVAILRNWLSPDETSNPLAVQNTLAPAATSATMSRRNGHAPSPPGTLPLILASAIGMVLGGLTITAGIVLAIYAFLTQDVELGAFWGWMGGAFGCIVGGIGALTGSWNTYRQIEGAEDLMHSPRWTWLDQGLVVYTVLGSIAIVAAVAVASHAAKVVTYSLLNLGGIVVFQGVLFLAFRGLYRKAAQQEAGRN